MIDRWILLSLMIIIFIVFGIVIWELTSYLIDIKLNFIYYLGWILRVGSIFSFGILIGKKIKKLVSTTDL